MKKLRNDSLVIKLFIFDGKVGRGVSLLFTQ